jgi:SAM-dependent methyltransferase
MIAHHHGALDGVPANVVELGPGDSLGVGLAALLSGSSSYIAFDAVRHANTETNLQAFDGLVALFRERADVPAGEEFPLLRPLVQSHGFPGHVLTDEVLDEALTDDRLARIRESIRRPDEPDSMIRYEVPWDHADVRERSSVDLILSQAVLQHLDDLDESFEIFNSWLRPGGVMSHQVDFSAGLLSREWNAPWTYGDLEWKITRGKRPYFLNREPLSGYVEALGRTGFEVLHVAPTEAPSQIPRSKLASRFAGLSEQDLTTRDAYILAAKR